MQFETAQHSPDYAGCLVKAPTINLLLELVQRNLGHREREQLALLAAQHPESPLNLEEYLLLKWFRNNRHIGLRELQILTHTE